MSSPLAAAFLQPPHDDAPGFPLSTGTSALPLARAAAPPSPLRPLPADNPAVQLFGDSMVHQLPLVAALPSPLRPTLELSRAGTALPLRAQETALPQRASIEDASAVPQSLAAALLVPLPLTALFRTSLAAVLPAPLAAALPPLPQGTTSHDVPVLVAPTPHCCDASPAPLLPTVEAPFPPLAAVCRPPIVAALQLPPGTVDLGAAAAVGLVAQVDPGTKHAAPQHLTLVRGDRDGDAPASQGKSSGGGGSNAECGLPLGGHAAEAETLCPEAYAAACAVQRAVPLQDLDSSRFYGRKSRLLDDRSCTLCDYNAKSPGSLMLHMKAHERAGMVPLSVCSECGQRYLSLSSMKKHWEEDHSGFAARILTA
jgi:hypothetical protein